jgi:hypothetical protein
MVQVEYLYTKNEELKGVKELLSGFLDKYTHKPFRIDIDGKKIRLTISDVETWQSMQELMNALNFVLKAGGYLDFIVGFELS